VVADERGPAVSVAEKQLTKKMVAFLDASGVRTPDLLDRYQSLDHRDTCLDLNLLGSQGLWCDQLAV
jgi:hypothetical protein